MSWNGDKTSAPNWAGETIAEVETPVGDLYIVPDPPNITTNPSIGLEERNEVPLPTAYRDLSATNGTFTNINGNANFDASNWWRYPANGNVTATQAPIPIPYVPNRIYDITGFKDIKATNVYCDVDGLVPNTGQINAGTGNIGTINSSVVNVGLENNKGVVDIDGTSNLAGFNALSVKGGTTLSGNGDIHGVTIGALLDPTETFDLNRIDVLPIGIDLTSATYFFATAAGASSLSAGGALSLAGGSYIEYNSDEHYFINTSAGNDFTDLYVGNIHPANGGSGTLNINGDRGVTLSDVKSINLFTDGARPAWNNLTTYNPDTIVTIGTTYYFCKVLNANTNPSIEIPFFVLNDPYPQYTIIYQNTAPSGAYRAKTTIVSATLQPSADPTNWLLLGAPRDITLVWGVHTPVVSTITGDPASILTIGTINSTSNITDVEIGGLGLKGKLGTEGLFNFNYLRLQKQIGSDAVVQFYDGAVLKALMGYGADDKLLIQTDTGLVINNTAGNTDFSAGNVTNITNILLTSDLKPTWGAGVPYTYAQMVYYLGASAANYTNLVDGGRQNFNNIPDELMPWVSGGEYILGNIRVDNTLGSPALYYCKISITGSTTAPNLNTTNWELYSNSVATATYWEPSAIPTSGLIGDANSLFSVGGAKFFNRIGEYLSIQNGDPTLKNAEFNSDGLMAFSAQEGLVMFAQNEGVGIVSADGVVTLTSLNGPVSVQSLNDTASITGGLGATLESEAGDVEVQTISSGDVNISSIDNINITSVNEISISTTGVNKIIGVVSTGEINLSTTGATGGINLTTAGANADISLTSSDNLTLTSADNMLIQASGVGATLSLTGYGNTSLSSSVGNISVLGDYVNVQGSASATLQATAGDCNLGAGSGSSIKAFSNLVFDNAGVGNKITGRSTGLTIENLTELSPSSSSISFNSANLTNVSTINGKFLFNYGYFYNTATQTLTSTNTATRVVMNTSGDNFGVTLDTTTNIGRITIANTGIFHVVWNAYLKHGSGGSVKSVVWIRKNGSDLAGTGKTENNDNQQDETNMTSSALVSITAGDYIEFYWAANGTNVPLTAITASSPYPLTPSFSATIQIVG